MSSINQKLMKAGWVRKLRVNVHKTKYMEVYIYIQGVTGGKDQTSGGCSLC